MIFWIIAGLIAALTVALLLRGLQTGPKQPPAPNHDLAVYRDQLAEVERDLERGLLTEAEAEGARIEIQRRILASDRKSDSTSGQALEGGKPLSALAVAIAVLIPAASLGLYLSLGAPGQEGLPFAQRPTVAPDGTGEQASVLAQIDQRLEAHPDDARAWFLKAHLLRKDGRPEAAAEAYRQSLRLEPDQPEARIGLTEALVALADGEVTQEARGQLAAVLQVDPANPSARYYAGLALVQDGFFPQARQVWSDLLAGAPPDAAWIPVVRRQLAHLEAAMGEAPAPEAPRGPSSDDVAAAEAMTPAERQAFIRSMVDRLAARMADDPENLEGWLRLGNAYSVLGEEALARQALARAEALAADLPDDSPLRGAVNEALRKLPNSD